MDSRFGRERLCCFLFSKLVGNALFFWVAVRYGHRAFPVQHRLSIQARATGHCERRMPPKAPPPPAIDLDQVWAEAQDAEIVIAAVLEGVLSDAFAAIDARHVGERAVTHAVLSVAHQMSRAMELLLMECDPGEGDIRQQASWQVDTEPVPAPIDSWSRGAIKSKERKDLGPRVPSPPASEMGGGSQFGGSRASNSPRRGGGPRKASPLEPMPSLQEKQGPPVAKSRNPPNDRIRSSQVLVTPAEEAAARRAADEREDQRRAEELRASMHGQEYTMDAAGNVIPVDVTPPERLPPYKLYPGIGLHTGEDDAPSAPKKASKAAKAAVKSSGSSDGPPQMSLAAASYQPLNSMQPPLMDSLQVREGVTLRESEAVKEGGSRPVDPQRMSRKDFELFTRTAQANAEALMAADPAVGAVDPMTLETPLVGSPLVDGAAASPNTTHQQPKGWGQNPPMQQVVPPRQPHAKPTGMRERGANAVVEGANGTFVPAFRERGGTAVKNRVPPPPPSQHRPPPRTGT